MLPVVTDYGYIADVYDSVKVEICIMVEIHVA